MAEEPRWVPLGKITRLHGTRGSVKVFPYGETIQGLARGDRVYLGGDSSQPGRALRIESVGRQKRLLIVRFETIVDTLQAEALVGREIRLPEDRLPPTEEGEFYHYQLIGLLVKTTDGRALGTLSSILETGTNDVYVVTERQGRELLIPALDDVIQEVDLDDRVMIVDPPEGLPP